MLTTLVFLLLAVCVVLATSLVSDISHQFLHSPIEQGIYEPSYYAGNGAIIGVRGNGAQFAPLYGMTNSHLLSLTDLLRKRTLDY